MTMKHGACLAFVAVFSVTRVCASEIGDPEKGRALARDICGQCHAVRNAQLLSPNLSAPTFFRIATTPGMTAAALTVTLTTPHAGMPMFHLSSEDRRDVIAYILNLKGHE
jgi:mono/diheme cytochrome c family protein